LHLTEFLAAELISDADDLLAGFDSLPVTLAHHDPQWGNLFAAAPDESPARMVTIDWGFIGLATIGSDLGLHIGQNIMSWGIDQRRAAEHDQASTAAYTSGLQDYGWNGDVDSVKFARATAAALNAGTWLAIEVSWLVPTWRNDLDPTTLHGRPGLRQRRELAQQPWWKAGLPASTMYSILRTRLASYCRTFIVEAFAVQRCVAVRVSVSAH
jgi:hypothetical protein